MTNRTTLKTKKKTTSLLIASILLTGMMGLTSQSAHAVPSIIDFEGLCTSTISDPIDTADNSVTLQVGTTLGGAVDGYVVTVGAEREAFQVGDPDSGNTPSGDGLADDTPHNTDGTIYAEGGDCFYSDDVSGFNAGFNYYINFTNPVNSLSVDLYDYSDDGNFDEEVPIDCTGNAPCDGDVATLTVYDDLAQTSIVGTATYEVDDQNWFDGQVANLSIFSETSFISASITFSNIDRGTGIDNIAFEELTVVNVAKFYDTNHDGIHDEGEVFLEDWLVHVNDTSYGYEFTNATYVLAADEIFNATEFIPNNGIWIPTNDTVVTFNSTEVDEILFSNVCIDESDGNPHTKGFWSNKNGQKLCEEYESAFAGNMTQFPNFVDADNEPKTTIDTCEEIVHDKSTKPPTKNYLKLPTHGNINYTLSQQLLTMVLNNSTESVNPEDEVYCDSIGEFFTLNELMTEGNATLAGVGSYAAGDLAECLDDANNDKNFVQDEACEYDFGTTLEISKVLTELDTTYGNNTNVPSDEGIFWWNVTISNTGNWPAVNANLTDISNSTNDHNNQNDCDDAGTETFCNLGDLENGNPVQIDIAGEVDEPGDVIVNTASTIAENALEAIYVLVNTIIEEVQ